MVIGPHTELPSQSQPGSSAATYPVPQEWIVSIEHPCIVKNLDNGLKSLGGMAQMKHVIEHNVGDGLIKVGDKAHHYPEPVAGVSLRPNDAFATKLSSTGVETRNILVKVTVPKWTGRKRKRGSDELFGFSSPLESTSVSITACDLLQRMRDNLSAYSIEAVGMIPETHRFRSQPDFQMHTADLPVMREIKHLMQNPRYDDFQNFNIDLETVGSGSNSFPLPPTFIGTNQPYKYDYEQALGIVYGFDEQGNAIATNTTTRDRRQVDSIAADAPTVLDGPPSNLRLGAKANTKTYQCIRDIKQLLEKRPIVTRRVLMNELPEYHDTVLKDASQYAGYMFSAGPFRDCLIRYGVDPRADPKYRMYQTLMFALEKDLLAKSEQAQANRPTNNQALKASGKSHVFDGQTVPSNTKTYQICDITDPLLRSLLETEDLPRTCDPYQTGWYYSGTVAKARVIMRDKVKCLLLGEEPPEADYRFLADMPNEITSENVFAARVENIQHTSKLLELAKDYRMITKTLQSTRKVKGWSPKRGGAGGKMASQGGIHKALAGDGGRGAIVGGSENHNGDSHGGAEFDGGDEDADAEGEEDMDANREGYRGIDGENADAEGEDDVEAVTREERRDVQEDARETRHPVGARLEDVGAEIERMAATGADVDGSLIHF